MEGLSRIAKKVARSVMAEERDEALEIVDQSVDVIIAALTSLDENLPMVKTENVPQKAAIDSVQGLLDEAVKPYFSDVVKALSIFGD